MAGTVWFTLIGGVTLIRLETGSPKENITTHAHPHTTPNWQQTGWTGGHGPRSSGFTLDTGSVAQPPGLPLQDRGGLWEEAPALLKFPCPHRPKINKAVYTAGYGYSKQSNKDPVIQWSELQLSLPVATNCQCI